MATRIIAKRVNISPDEKTIKISKRQRAAARLFLEAKAKGEELTNKELAKRAGYVENMNPWDITQRLGFKVAVEELAEELHIDKKSRLTRLSDIFWREKPKDAIEANKEIAKMLGDYAPEQKEYKDIRENRIAIIRPE